MTPARSGSLWRRMLAGVLVIALVLCGLGACAGDDSRDGQETGTAQDADATLDADVDELAGTDEDAEETEAVSDERESDADDEAGDDDLSGELVVHFIDVGQGDATFMELPDGTCMLVDAGTSAAASTVKSYIKKLGYSNIDYLVATHPDADHIGGLASVIAAFDIGEVWAPDATNDTATFEGFLDAVEDAGLQIDVAEKGVDIVSDASGCSIEVLGPAASKSSDDLNDCSAILLVEFGSTSVLLTGDASSDKIPAVDIDVLKVSHHGSDTGTTTSLAKKLSPSIAVISYGADNSYGHPTQNVLDALSAVDAAVYGTAVNGDVVVSSDGENVDVEVQSKGTVKAASSSSGSSSGSSSSGSSSESSSSKNSSTSSGSGTSKTVYVTASGTKYHTATCRYVKGKDNVTAMKKSKAKAAGYEACKVCDP